jgi:hypothetical protein
MWSSMLHPLPLTKHGGDYLPVSTTGSRIGNKDSHLQVGEQMANLLYSVWTRVSIFAARNLALFEGGKRVPATIKAQSRMRCGRPKIMKAIDDHWPAGR